MRISVVCIGTENAGNLGAVTRAMKNFGFKNLILVDPQCDPKSDEAISRAKHAKDVLKKAKVVGMDGLSGFDCVVGTTAMLGTDYNIPRSPLSPKQLAEKIEEGGSKGRLALVFGPEGTGLSNDLISKMDFIVTIPTSKIYPTLNLSHSVAVLLYEISKKYEDDKKVGGHIEPCGKRCKEVLLKKVEGIISNMTFPTTEKANTQRTLWRRIIGKSMPTKREAFALLGFFRKVEGLQLEKKIKK